MKEVKDYYLGLDMGTSSVGWAVTDENYNLMRAKGKDMWGIREFEEASIAKDRRINRASRRRREKELVREGYLRQFFAEAIAAEDPNFYARLDNSKYFLEDKDENVRYKSAIFHDIDFTDREYYALYPTVFHLRKALIENSVSVDNKYTRFVFLALHNMFKHRGHFLNDAINEDVDVTAMDVHLCRFFELAAELLGISFNKNISEKNIKDIYAQNNISRSKKAECLEGILEIDSFSKESKTIAKLLIKALCGLSVDYVKVFKIETENDEKAEIAFTKADYDEEIVKINTLVGDENAELISVMKAIFDVGSLASILGDHNYISNARVETYNKHHDDLKKLKAAVCKYVPDIYDNIFRNEIDGSYVSYVKSTNVGKLHNRRGAKNRKNTDLYDTLKKLFKPFAAESDVAEILKDIDAENFLPRQLTSANGVIPNQVHLKEMRVILNNAEKHLTFLKERDDTGLSVSEKIIELFTFRMPYYIGPVSESKNCINGWAERKESGAVLPWNLEQKIDINKTSEKFITNLIRECTYLAGEKVMPKASLAYEKYCVLNEINNIKIRGERIDVSLKQDIYTQLFENNSKVTRSKLLKFIRTKDSGIQDSDISGIDTNINNSLGSYAKFRTIFGDDMKLDSCKSLVEEIIYFGTIYGDDKKRFREVIKDKFSERLSEVELQRISGMKFRDWGRFSKSFLELQGCDKCTGEMKSLLQAMWDTNLNMMELINSEDYTFAQALEDRKKKLDKCLSEFTFKDLDDYYFSAPVKRMIWQTLLLIKEIQKVLGKPPKAIFIEMTRTDEEKGDKGRKNSREKDLLELYKSIKDDTHKWNELIKSEGSSGRLKSKKMYLYIKQMGRDVYTGKPIDLDLLMNDNIYDIDHIYPRQFTTDNNIENNLVLVNKQDNAKKTNVFPLDSSIRNNPDVMTLWRTLHEKKLMNDEKYNRLTRTTEFTDEEQAQFIARQLVETSQGTKGVADLLKQLTDTEIIYSKASNVSKFRDKFDIVKCRSLNELHHAHDAYLNIVVGNIYDTKFTKSPINFIKNYKRDVKRYHYNLDKMYDWDVKNGEKVAWIASDSNSENTGTIATVKRVLKRATPLMTRMSFEGHGGIANATLYSADSAKPGVYIPLKSSDKKIRDVTKYGGFTSVSTAYFFLVEHEVKGKRIRTIESLPIYKKSQVEKSDNALETYCRDELKLVNPSVRLKKINLQSLIKLNGYYVYVSGKTNNQLVLYNAVNMCLDSSFLNIIREIDKLSEKVCLCDSELYDETERLFTALCNKHTKTVFFSRPNAIATIVESSIETFKSLDINMRCYCLKEIIKATQIGSVPGVDLSSLGGASKAGVMLMSKKLTNYDSVKVINQSITGIYEHEIDLLTV